MSTDPDKKPALPERALERIRQAHRSLESFRKTEAHAHAKARLKELLSATREKKAREG